METEKVIEALTSRLGEDKVITDDKSRSFYASDLFFSGPEPLAIVVPTTRDELCQAIKLCTALGVALLPRGGGLSYTAGYVQTDASTGGAIVLDSRQLNNIIDVNPSNMTVSVEAGCTWEQVYEATSAHGLRVPMFGPSTGRYSTVGGSLSNNCMFFGSGTAGTASDSVLGLDIVTADGTVITTGSGSIVNGMPFFRNHGPDLTGLFLNDGGALGVKAAATLKLEPIPEGLALASYSLPSFDALIPAIQAIGKSGLTAECLGVGPAPLGELSGATLHVVCEGWTQEIAEAHAAAIQNLIGADATSVDPAVPSFIRGNPFAFVQSPLDAKGRLQIWTHGVFALGETRSAYEGFMAVLEDAASDMATHEIDATLSFACAGTAMMVEPVLYWHGTASDLHLSGMAQTESQGQSTSGEREALVREIRERFRSKMDDLGAAHMQYGRFYRYDTVTEKSTVDLVKGIKKLIDPGSLINPGVLGL